jgi:putative flippase GtrA
MDLKQVIRFGVVGSVNTGFSFGLYLCLVWLGLHYVAANLLATIAGILFSFRTQGRFVFGDTRWRQLWRFVPVWAGLFGFNTLLIAVFVRLDLNAYQAGALALLPTVILSYFVQKHFVFEPPSPNRPVESP